MAMDQESEIMDEIGLGGHYSYFNGSGSCRCIRRVAVEKLPAALRNRGLDLAPAWETFLSRAERADEADGREFTLTNVWVTCSYAIQDAIYRQAGNPPMLPEDSILHFMDGTVRQRFLEPIGRGSMTRPYRSGYEYDDEFGKRPGFGKDDDF